MLQQLMADADLDALGRDAFFDRSDRLRAERESFGDIRSTRDWYLLQIDFVGGHQYFTQAARTLRDPGKTRNIETMRDILRNLPDDANMPCPSPRHRPPQ